MKGEAGRSLLVVLGAGDSRRMGRPKVLLESGGKAHLLRILETARGVGIEDSLVAARGRDLPALLELGVCPASLHRVPEDLRALGPIGSLASVVGGLLGDGARAEGEGPPAGLPGMAGEAKGDTHACSLASPQAPAYAGLVVWPVDHPWVQVETLRALLGAGGSLRVPVFGGSGGVRGGHPVWLGAAHWPRILRLAEESRTLRALFQEEAGKVQHIPVQDPGVLRNLNRPEDLA